MWSPSLVGSLLLLSLGMVATTTSSVPLLYIATFCISCTGSLHFDFALQLWFSCSLTEPGQGSCRLYAVRCVTGYQVIRYTLISRGRSPLDLTAVKVIFDTSITVHLRSTPLSLPYNFSTYFHDSYRDVWNYLDLVAQYRFVKNQHHKAVWKILLKGLSDRAFIYTWSVVRLLALPFFWLVTARCFDKRK